MKLYESSSSEPNMTDNQSNNSLLAEDQSVLDILSAASQMYDEYLRINSTLDLLAEPEETPVPKYSWDFPLNLVIRDQN